MPGGQQYVDAIQRVWDAGDAVLPVDQRLPKEMQKQLIKDMGASEVVNSSGSFSLEGKAVEPGDALVVATSGSTGQPKGVVLTHESLAANAEATSDFLEVDPAVDKWLACLPLSHVGGFSVVVAAVFCVPALMYGGGLILFSLAALCGTALIAGWIANRQIGGQTGDVCGAVQILSETAGWVCLTVLLSLDSA